MLIAVSVSVPALVPVPVSMPLSMPVLLSAPVRACVFVADTRSSKTLHIGRTTPHLLQ